MRLSSMRVGLEFSDRACVLSKCPTLCDPMDCSPPSPSSPGKNTGMGGHFLVQRIFPAQGSNLPLLSLLLQQADSLPPCHLGTNYTSQKPTCLPQVLCGLHGCNVFVGEAIPQTEGAGWGPECTPVPSRCSRHSTGPQAASPRLVSENPN